VFTRSTRHICRFGLAASRCALEPHHHSGLAFSLRAPVSCPSTFRPNICSWRSDRGTARRMLKGMNGGQWRTIIQRLTRLWPLTKKRRPHRGQSIKLKPAKNPRRLKLLLRQTIVAPRVRQTDFQLARQNVCHQSSIATITFPLACPASRYSNASLICAKGNTRSTTTRSLSCSISNDNCSKSGPLPCMK
jgi:hypothetical protein